MWLLLIFTCSFMSIPDKYAVDCITCYNSTGDITEDRQKEVRACPKEITKCYLSGDIKKGDGTTSGADDFYEQGCGECPIPSIPCRSCSVSYCNDGAFFKYMNYCWDKENVVKVCRIEETKTSEKSQCYYAVINGNTVEQGCEEDINWNEKNMQIIKCVMPICNTKGLYDNTLFCLNKGKDDLETKKARDKCDDGMCFVHRHWDDGKLEQGCGKCPENVPSTDCITCTKKFCNEEREVKKYCWDNNKLDKKCRTLFDDYCFAERKQNNKFEYSVNKGCGKCPTLACKSCKENLCNDGKNIPNNFCLYFDGKSAMDCDDYECYITLNSKTGCGNCDKNKINEPCVDCKGLNCNTEDIIKNELFCNVSDENGNQKGNRKCLGEKQCFISVDLNKVHDENSFKKYTKQGCGECSSNKIPCRICNTKFCNSEKFLKKVNFCWVKEEVIECEINERNCYYSLNNGIEVIQGCGKGLENKTNLLNINCEGNLCNTKELFDKSLFCLNKEKYENEKKSVLCNQKCFVWRHLDGNLEQGCRECPKNLNSTECQTCDNQKSCNLENLVNKHCYTNEGENCKVSFYNNCFMARNETNGVNKGCGECNNKSKFCKTCNENLCNDGKDLPFYCFNQNKEKECKESFCYIANNKDSNGIFESNCGKCPEEIQTNCAQCNNTPLCNTEKLLKNSFYCLEFTEVMEKTMESYIGCESKCFVERIKSQLRQGCKMCGINQTREECFNCNTNYCNKENKVHKQCWVKNKKLCNSSHNSYCFMERNSTNKINKGCENCSTLACKKCFDNRCNAWKDIPYYCYSFNGTTKIVKECSFTEPDCYIVKINNNKDEEQNQFHYNCGKCPASNEDFLNTRDSHLLKITNKTNINSLQCAECNKGPLCNTKELFEKQLFCWEKSANESEMTKMTRTCKSECFVYRDLNGNVTQGCNKCPKNNSSIDCVNCKEKYCNLESLLPKQCYTNNGNTCKTSFNDFCFMEINKINEINKGCGNCSSKACRKCLENRCNNWNDKPNFCYGLNGSHKIVKECSNPDCYIMKLNNKGEYKYDCGNCSQSKPFPCVDCKNEPLCNSEENFESKLFCLDKSTLASKTTKETRECKKNECFVGRTTSQGIVKQGCGNCASAFTNGMKLIDCKSCNKSYCNEEKIITKQCYADSKDNCNTEFDAPCYIYRTPTNEVKKGCGKCPFYTCKECTEHLCNENIAHYCFGYMGSYKECFDKDSYCYIAKIEVENGEDLIEQFHYDCGKCPSNILLNLTQFIQTKNIQIKNKLIKINMSNIQCAQCNKSPACNADPFFESQLFCWEKDFNKWKQNKGKRVCEIGFCFIGVDKNELVQGCGKCTEQQNLTKCINCSTPLCNTKEILPSPIKCFHQNTNFQSKTNKTCHHIILLEIFFGENCGECPTKYKNFVKCNNSDFCNKESLIPLITTNKIIITTTTKNKEETS